MKRQRRRRRRRKSRGGGGGGDGDGRARPRPCVWGRRRRMQWCGNSRLMPLPTARPKHGQVRPSIRRDRRQQTCYSLFVYRRRRRQVTYKHRIGKTGEFNTLPSTTVQKSKRSRRTRRECRSRRADDAGDRCGILLHLLCRP